MSDTTKMSDLYFKLFNQALRDIQDTASIYGATPPIIGKTIGRFAELCNENGICHKCGEPVSPKENKGE